MRNVKRISTALLGSALAAAALLGAAGTASAGTASGSYLTAHSRAPIVDRPDGSAVGWLTNGESRDVSCKTTDGKWAKVAEGYVPLGHASYDVRAFGNAPTCS